jgi:hypothetical protein
MILLVVPELLFGQEHETLRIVPAEATLHVGQPVAFTAAIYDRHGQFLSPRHVTWQANNLTDHQAASVSSQGVFIPAALGEYRITAKARNVEGRATVRVFEGVPRSSNARPSTITNAPSSANLGNPAAGAKNSTDAPTVGNNSGSQRFDVATRRGRDPLRR